MLPSSLFYRTAVVSLFLAILTGGWYLFMADGRANMTSSSPVFVADGTEIGDEQGGTGNSAVVTAEPSFQGESATMPAPAPTQTPTPSPTPLPALTYTVEPGDALATIGERFGVSIEALAQANALQDPDALVIGQTLTIPR